MTVDADVHEHRHTSISGGEAGISAYGSEDLSSNQPADDGDYVSCLVFAISIGKDSG